MPRKPPPAGDVRYALGDLIKTRRLAVGLSQHELANVIGVSFTAVQYWEQGARAPSMADLIRLARASDLPLSAYLSLLDDFEVPAREVPYRPSPRRRKKAS